MGNLKQNKIKTLTTMRTFITLALLGVASAVRLNDVDADAVADAAPEFERAAKEMGGDKADWEGFADDLEKEMRSDKEEGEDGERSGKKGKKGGKERRVAKTATRTPKETMASRRSAQPRPRKPRRVAKAKVATNLATKMPKAKKISQRRKTSQPRKTKPKLLRRARRVAWAKRMPKEKMANGPSTKMTSRNSLASP